MEKFKLIIFSILMSCSLAFGQQDIVEIENKLNELAVTQLGLNEKVEINISGIP